MIKIGITGGIGSGKSVICKLIETLGFPVYYSDNRAKELINNSPTIINFLKEKYGKDIYINKKINKKKFASIIFNSKEELKIVNSIIHPEVAKDFTNWATEQKSKIVFQESALIFESRIENRFDYIIGVIAKHKTRVVRVINRETCTIEDVEERIKNQLSQDIIIEKSDFIIKNENNHPILPQLLNILENIK